MSKKRVRIISKNKDGTANIKCRCGKDPHCGHCSGKGFVKMAFARLEEYKP